MNAAMGIKGKEIRIIIQSWAVDWGNNAAFSPRKIVFKCVNMSTRTGSKFVHLFPRRSGV